MIDAAKKLDGDKPIPRWMLVIGFVVISLSLTFTGIQWQQTEAAVDSLTQKVAKLEDDFEKDFLRLEQVIDAEIARLDESNRNRRNDLADLEERVARVEERTGG
jgi:hypothetical protein